MKIAFKYIGCVAFASVAWVGSTMAAEPKAKNPSGNSPGGPTSAMVESLTVVPAQLNAVGPAQLNVAIAVSAPAGGASCAGTLTVFRPDSGALVLSSPVTIPYQGAKLTLQPNFTAAGDYAVRLVVNSTPNCQGGTRTAPVKVKADPDAGNSAAGSAGAVKLSIPGVALKSVELAQSAKPGDIMTFRVALAGPAGDFPGQRCYFAVRINDVQITDNLAASVPKGTENFQFTVASHSLGLKSGKHTVEVRPTTGAACFNNAKGEFMLALGQMNIARLMSVAPATTTFDDALLMRFNIRYVGKGKCSARVFVNGHSSQDMPDLELPDANGDVTRLVDLSKYILARIPPDQRKGTHTLILEDRTPGHTCDGKPETTFTLVQDKNKLVAIRAFGEKLTEPVQLEVELGSDFKACEKISLDVNGRVVQYDKPPIVNGLYGKSHKFIVTPFDLLYAFKEENQIKATGLENCAGSVVQTQLKLEKKSAKDLGKLTKVSIANQHNVTNYGDLGIAAGTPLELRFEGSGVCVFSIHLVGTNQWEHKRTITVEMPKNGGATLWKSDFNLPPYGKAHLVSSDGKTDQNKAVENKDFQVSVVPNLGGCVGLPAVLKDKATCFKGECKP